MNRIISIFGLLLCCLCSMTTKATNIVINTLENNSQKKVADVIIYLYDEKNKSYETYFCNDNGSANIYTNQGEYTISVSHVNYIRQSHKLNVMHDTLITINMVENNIGIQEVCITAEESKNIQNSSIIGIEAMKHLQPKYCRFDANVTWKYFVGE